MIEACSFSVALHDTGCIRSHAAAIVCVDLQLSGEVGVHSSKFSGGAWPTTIFLTQKRTLWGLDGIGLG